LRARCRGDFIYTHCLPPRLLSAASEAAQAAGTTAWHLFREGLRAARTEPCWKPVGMKFMNEFVTPEVLARFQANPEFARPQRSRSAAGISFGKLQHIDQAFPWRRCA
jgi:hypothetical protein